MTNRSKRLGTEAEDQARDFFRANGWPYCERMAQNGRRDRGDLTGIPGVVIEVKAGALENLSKWMVELKTEMANAQTDVGLLAVKPRGKRDGATYYAIMPMAVAAKLLKGAGW